VSSECLTDAAVSNELDNFTVATPLVEKKQSTDTSVKAAGDSSASTEVRHC